MKQGELKVHIGLLMGLITGAWLAYFLQLNDWLTYPASYDLSVGITFACVWIFIIGFIIRIYERKRNKHVHPF